MTSFTPAIWIHVTAAVAALGLGGAVFLARKGTPAHRMAGRAWAALMVVTAVSTYWIRGDGGFSWIHLLSVATLGLLAAAVVFAMTHRVQAHRKTVTGLYLGALVVAGAFAFLPDRLLGRALWGFFS
jgi:uncharacterized membrane protein